MASLRTAADVQAEYNAVRAAYLRALEAESYSRSDSDQSRSVQRAAAADLREQMLKLEREYDSLTGGGITMRGAVPIDG